MVSGRRPAGNEANQWPEVPAPLTLDTEQAIPALGPPSPRMLGRQLRPQRPQGWTQPQETGQIYASDCVQPRSRKMGNKIGTGEGPQGQGGRRDPGPTSAGLSTYVGLHSTAQHGEGGRIQRSGEIAGKVRAVRHGKFASAQNPPVKWAGKWFRSRGRRGLGVRRRHSGGSPFPGAVLCPEDRCMNRDAQASPRPSPTRPPNERWTSWRRAQL